VSAQHICSQSWDVCPACGHTDTRDAFEGWEKPVAGASVFFVRCPECEAEHPDQANWDDRDCDACEEEGRYD
jgi:hypothetical protein